MSLNYLSEAFNQLSDILNEEDFRLNDVDSIDKVKNFLDLAQDSDETEVEVIDSNAKEKNDIQDSYIGKVILDCCTCHSKQYKDPQEVFLDENQEWANIDEECPFCYSVDGYKVVGQVTEYEADEDEDEIEVQEDETDAEYEVESLQEAKELSKKEGTLSNALMQAQEQINNCTSLQELVEVVTETLPEDNSATKQFILNLKAKGTLPRGLKYVYDVILKGDGLGVTLSDSKGNKWESLKEDTQASEVVSKYQRWVDFDMKRYGKISDKTNYLLSKAGLQVVKDDHGDYEVITKTDENLNEDFEKVEIETDKEKMSMTSDKDGKVSVITEPKSDMAEPVDLEMQDMIKTNSEETEPAEVDAYFDVEDFDEKSFDQVSECYLKKVYENVNSYKTRNVSVQQNKLFVEGIIEFKSGAKKATQFIFEAKKTGTNGKKFIGENAQLTKGKKSFTISGNVKDKKFITESLNYNYKAKDVNGKSIRLYGTMRKSK